MSTTLFERIYPVKIIFTRTFHAGLLAGISMPDTMRFINRTGAAQWVRAIRSNSRAGLLDYRISKVQS